MLARELENIAKALPEFVDLTQSVKNPFQTKKTPPPEKDDLSLVETASKSLWFVIPFHLFAFLGFAPAENTLAAITTTIFAGMLCLVLLMWSGSVLALIPYSSDRKFKERAGLWVTGLICSWFFVSFCLAVVHLLLALQDGKIGNMLSRLRTFLLPHLPDGLDYMAVYYLVPTLFGVLALSILSRGQLFSSGPSAKMSGLLFLGICWLICLLMLFTSTKLLT